ncbi:hypothetical protein KY284_030606 [Solanum tuberosum]|nr:hypothetical protein KY284_030606 [Solanum tuberosum]
MIPDFQIKFFEEFEISSHDLKSRPIRWDEIDFPQEWVIEGAAQPKDNTNNEVSEIEQFEDGTVPSRASTSQIRENYRCDNIRIDKDNIARPMPRPSSDLDIIESEMNFPDGIST